MQTVGSSISTPSAKNTSGKSEPYVTADTIAYVDCPDCGRNLPADNLLMHQAHCARMLAVKNARKELEAAQPNTDNRKSSKKRGSSNKGKKRNKNNVGQLEDDDVLIEKAMASAKVCKFLQCKTSVSLISHVCSMCKMTFCLEHCMSEVHGCGKPQRTNKQVPVCHNGVLHNVSRNKNKLSDAKHKLVKKQLDDKIKALEKTRGRKTSKGSKKK